MEAELIWVLVMLVYLGVRWNNQDIHKLRRELNELKAR